MWRAVIIGGLRQVLGRPSPAPAPRSHLLELDLFPALRVSGQAPGQAGTWYQNSSQFTATAVTAAIGVRGAPACAGAGRFSGRTCTAAGAHALLRQPRAGTRPPPSRWR